MNRRRLHALLVIAALPVMAVASGAPGQASAAGTPAPAHDAFNGVWQIEKPVVELHTVNGSAPPLRDAARQTYERRRAQRAAGDRSYDVTLRCKPMGEPRTAYDPDGGPFEIVVNPKVVAFGHTWNRMVRFVYINDAPVDVIGPTYYGTANGRWVGDVLQIDAQGFHDTTLLDAAGLPHSEQLRLQERFRLIDGGRRLEETIRFEDPQTFTSSWSARLVFTRRPGAQIAEDHCEERLNIKDY